MGLVNPLKRSTSSISIPENGILFKDQNGFTKVKFDQDGNIIHRGDIKRSRVNL